MFDRKGSIKTTRGNNWSRQGQGSVVSKLLPRPPLFLHVTSPLVDGVVSGMSAAYIVAIGVYIGEKYKLHSRS